MAKGTNVAVTAFSWVCLLLDFCGWVLLLSGVAAMQKACGDSEANQLLVGFFPATIPPSPDQLSASGGLIAANLDPYVGTGIGGGIAGYNAAVSCDVFFMYTWWMTFFNLAVLLFVAGVLASGTTHIFRPGVIALLSIATMMSIIIANNYLYYDTIPTSSGAFTARAKVTAAGAIIKSVALLLLLGLQGARDESTTIYEPKAKPAAEQVRAAKRTPLGPPVSTNPLEPEPEFREARRVTTSSHAATVSPV